ncbi:MAG: radical SAM protein [Phycisphaera sp.]|nr:radical SAM protein [Phycisphaera sp.]
MSDSDQDSPNDAPTPSKTEGGGTLRINEIFHSIQGESTRAGEPCIFVRLAGCHLRCAWCDTEYAFREGDRRSVDEVLEQVLRIDCPLVELTGGEPLLQKSVHELERRLHEAGRTVLVETSGACDITACDPRTIVIMDLKAPSSGESDRNLPGNLEALGIDHEVKFVIGGREDYDWAVDLIRRERLHERTAAVLFSPVFPQASGLEIAGAPGIEPRILAEWILEDALPVRMQLQLHKFIWEPTARGV